MARFAANMVVELPGATLSASAYGGGGGAASLRLDQVWDVLYRHPIIGAALEIIDDEVFSGGLDVYYNDAPAHEALNAYAQRHLLPFLRNVLHTVIVQGVVPVKVDDRHGDTAEPYVPEPGTYVVSLRQDRYRSFYELYALADVNGARDPHVLFLEHYRPLYGGMLTSPLGRLLAQSAFQDFLEECARTAEEIASRPTIFTVTRQDGGSGGGGVVDHMADADATRVFAAKTFLRDTVTAQAIECQKRRVDGAHTDPSERVLKNDIFPLPASQQPAAQVLPRARQDLVELRRLYEQVACALLGVPRSIIISDTSVRGAEEATSRALTMRVQRWKAWLADAAERTVQFMFSRAIAKRAVENFRLAFGRVPASRYEERRALDTVRISFTFPSLSMATPANLRELWLDGFFVDDRAYGEERFRMHGLPLEKLAKTRRVPAGAAPAAGAAGGGEPGGEGKKKKRAAEDGGADADAGGGSKNKQKRAAAGDDGDDDADDGKAERRKK